MSTPLPRVVSLLPSATEIVCGVGMRDALVGVSHECDFPGDVAELPIVTSSKVLAQGSSGAIDRDVRAILKSALAVYDVDTELLERLAPDVIVTQDLCDVCAVSLADVQRAVQQLTKPDVRIVNLHPTRLDDIWSDIAQVGAALGREVAASDLLHDLHGRVAQVSSRAARTSSRPHVLTVEWIDPVMVGGTWMPELVELAGGVPLVTSAGQHAPTLTVDELAALDPAPDVVLVKPCGFGLERTYGELDTLRRLLTDLDWPAVRAGEVWLADGNAYFNRPGPRIVDSLEILAACLHPNEFEDLAARYTGSFQSLALV